VSRLNNYHLVVTRRQNNFRLYTDNLNCIDYFQSFCSINELKTIIWHKKAVISCVGHMETAQNLCWIHKVYIECLLPHILPVLKNTGQFICFVHKILSCKLNNNLWHRLDEVFFGKILKYQGRVIGYCN